MFPAVLFLIGLVLSCVAAFYSVTGLAYVFAGAFWPVIIMGGALEAAKVAGASWVFREWRRASKVLLSYVAVGVVLLMLLTGVGIFGYLSRAYLVQQAPITQVAADVASAERAVALAQAQYDRDVKALDELSSGQTTDKVINRLTDANRLSGTTGAVSVLKNQQALQQVARQQVATSADTLTAAQHTLAQKQAEAQLQSVDVGPLMFAAKAWYGTNDTNTMDKTVRWFILLIMLVFDPMAIALLLAAQSLYAHTHLTPAPPTPPKRKRPSPPEPGLWTVTETTIPASPSPSAAPPMDREHRPIRRGMSAATEPNLQV